MTAQHGADVSVRRTDQFSIRTADRSLKLIKASLDRLENEGWIKEESAIEVTIRADVPREAGMGDSTAIIVVFFDASRKFFVWAIITIVQLRLRAPRP